jgi:preprotein translocase subunit SecG
MLAVFGILIILSSILLGLIVLIQNPKGGGLSGTFGGFSNQFMGVKQTTDVLEKGTWVFAAAVGILCMVSPAFIPKKSTSSGEDLLKSISTRPAKSTMQTPAPTPMPGAAGADSNK